MKHFYRMARMLLLIVCSMTVGLPQAKAQSSVINGIEYYDDVFTYDVIYSASDLGNYIEKKYVGTDYYLHTREYIKITGLKERWLTQHPEGAEAIEIPRTLRGSVYDGRDYYDYDLPVLDISKDAFKDNKYIKHVLVNDNLVRFQGFSGCTNLEDVTFVGFPKLIAFDAEALYGCEKLLSIEIPRNVDYIGRDAFRGCTSLMFVEFQDALYGGIDYIGDNAFRDCPKLARVNCPYRMKVRSLGRNVFTGTALTGTIANLALSPHMYEGCENLMYVVGSENWTEIPTECFTDCPNIVQIDLTQTYIKDLNLSALPTENVAFFELNDDLETIWGKWRGDKLTQFELSPSVREIGEDAFPNKELVFKGKCNLTHSLSHSFPNLETVFVFDDIKSNFARDCANLKTVIIRGQCKNIGDYAFMNCPNLEYASFGSNAPNVGDFAFADCPKLRQRGEIRLGNVGASAFRGCQFDATKFVGAHFKENSLGDKYTATIEMSDCTADARAFNGANFSDLVIPGTGIDRFGRNAFEGAHGKLTFDGTDKDSWYFNSPFSGALFTLVTTQDDALPEHIFYEMPALVRVVAPNLTPRLGFLATVFTPKFQGYAEVNNNSLKSVAQQNGETYYMTYSADMKTLYHVGDACGGIAKVAPECRSINSSIGQWPGSLATLMVLDLRDVTGNVTLTGSIDFKVPYGLITPGTESQFADLAKAGMQFITEYMIGDSNHDGQVDVEDIVVTATELGK